MWILVLIVGFSGLRTVLPLHFSLPQGKLDQAVNSADTKTGLKLRSGGMDLSITQCINTDDLMCGVKQRPVRSLRLTTELIQISTSQHLAWLRKLIIAKQPMKAYKYNSWRKLVWCNTVLCTTDYEIILFPAQKGCFFFLKLSFGEFH